ncbi:hypothetical protein HYH03_006678 [Edaphochlamys debaryana]|uniref:Uncharacterized protein n=1 Tax=Edaphochlamys debaryana TaxID=47281 RepID=A0A835Y4L0_9CHLO|nr:hypothetical protein HYH03_006678 [Edaphochlamys debaryana]|eukprot:KAG2495067.1 hypothetical protein HYH03_006678 [Edaphochlamys debaryana]
MALLLAGRRLPVLRDLSVMALNREGAVLASHPWLSAAMSTATGSGGSGKDAATTSPAAGTAPAADTAPVTTGSTPTTTPAQEDEEWTEVVHASGALYYWNQKTGETTKLGEPKPGTGEGEGGSDGSSGGGGSGSGTEGGHTDRGSSRNVRLEAPLDDRTGTYAAMGLLAGAFLGWFSQFV